MATKTCITCKNEKSVNDFSTGQANCKICRNLKAKSNNDKGKTVFQCPCGGTYQYYKKSKYVKTKQHIEGMKKSNPNGELEDIGNKIGEYLVALSQKRTEISI